jgi:hypothetical protein
MPDKNQTDPALSQLLKTWTVETSLPPRFEEQVWRKIARSEGGAPVPWWTLVQIWFQTAMPRPALAVACTVVFLAIGAMAGYWQAESKSARVDQALGDRYAQSIVPFTLAQR